MAWTTEDLADLMHRIQKSIGEGRLAELDRQMALFSTGTIQLDELVVPLAWLRVTSPVREQFKHWAALRDRLSFEAHARNIDPRKLLRGLELPLSN